MRTFEVHLPDVQILVRQVQRPGWVLLDTPVQRLDSLATLAVGRVVQELQARSSEAVLRHEDGLVGQGHLHSSVLVAIETRCVVGELENIRPLHVQVLGVVRVEESGRGVGVEGCGRGVLGDTAVKDNLARGIGARLDMGGGECGGSRCDQREEGLSVHDGPEERCGSSLACGNATVADKRWLYSGMVITYNSVIPAPLFP
jgi:hypothetical protein